MRGFVLVGGWPGSGKTTLARALASELQVPCLSKDSIKEALGPPSTVEESRELGRAAVFAVLRAAQGRQGAVIDSTWYPYSVPLVRELRGPLVELRCLLSLDVARERYHDRARDERHLDWARTEEELWAAEVAPLGLGPLIEVDTTGALELGPLVAAVHSALATDST